MSEAPATGRAVPRLLLITPPDAVWSAGVRLSIEAALGAGADGLLVRLPAASARAVFEFCSAARPSVRSAGARLFVHDRLDVAQAVDADGVHLAARSLPLLEARRLLPGAALGYSAHSEDEVRTAADEGADYVTISPVFETSSKPGAIPLGAELASAWSRAASLPTLWLGGLTADRLESVGGSESCALHGVAAIGAFADPDTAASEALRIRRWLRARGG